jgi:cytochrome c peroxidase
MNKWAIISFCVFAVALAAFRKKEAFFEQPKGWPAPVYNFKRNPLTASRIDLGRMLFYDPVLSKDSTISCSSCHLQATAFTHVDHDLSHGIAGRIGTRNSPALVNLAWSTSFMWDGAVNHLDVQALAPISNALEMDENLTHVLAKLQRSPLYCSMFYRAYGDSTVTGERLLKAMSQFMLTLVSADAKYDRVMQRTDTFSQYEARGYKLFQKHCNSCHTEPLFTNNRFENNGLAMDETLNDGGRKKITRQDVDSQRFKVPTLRNIEYSYPYMHDGRFKNLNQVLNNYIGGIQQSPTLHPLLQKGIYLSNSDKRDLIAFLSTLTDKKFLTNPKFGYPKEIFLTGEGLGR